MDEIERFQRGADEAEELCFRLPFAYPKPRSNTAELKARWEAHDGNVAATQEEDGTYRYNLVFTDTQRKALEFAYIAARRAAGHDAAQPYMREHLELFAGAFVSTIEGWADTMELFQAIIPATQKERERVLESISKSVTRLDEALSELDSEALGHWYAHVTDALAVSGIQLSEADNRMTSMLNHHLRAVVEAGELRQRLRGIIGTVVNATAKASATLRKYDHPGNDPRLGKARALERFLPFENGIPFDSSESGFAAICLRAIFDLAGVEYEKVSYWLKKAEDDPDSHAKWIKSLQNR